MLYILYPAIAEIENRNVYGHAHRTNQCTYIKENMYYLECCPVKKYLNGKTRNWNTCTFLMSLFSNLEYIHAGLAT